MRTYKLYFSNGKSTLIKANDREDAWECAKWYEGVYGNVPLYNTHHVLYIQFYHS